MRGLDAATVREAAYGHWGEIIENLCPELAEAVSRAPRHGPCPKHPSTDAFRFFKDYDTTGGAICNTCGTFADGFSVLQWANGWSFPEALIAIGEYLNLDFMLPLDPVLETDNGFLNDTANRLRIRAMWNETIPDDGTISRYLTHRGLSGVVPASLRLHTGMEYWDKDGTSLGIFYAMCAPVQNPLGDMVSIHRTYLNASGTGKAYVPEVKKLVKPVFPGATRGASIRLGPVGRKIAITEGIETGLAVQEHTGLTTLSTISAGNLEAFDPPQGVKEIEVWGDNDVSGTGQKSSARALRRLSARGYIVSVHLPPTVGKDWADVFGEVNNGVDESF